MYVYTLASISQSSTRQARSTQGSAEVEHGQMERYHSSMSNEGVLLNAVLKINTPCLTPSVDGCEAVVRLPLLDIVNFYLLQKGSFFYSIWLSIGQSFD